MLKKQLQSVLDFVLQCLVDAANQDALFPWREWISFFSQMLHVGWYSFKDLIQVTKVFPQWEYGIQEAPAVMGMQEEPKHSVFLKTCFCMTGYKWSPEVTQTHTPPIFSKPRNIYRQVSGYCFLCCWRQMTAHWIKLISFSFSSCFISYVPLSYVHGVIYRCRIN